MKPVRFHDAAGVEYIEALRWYVSRNQDAARRFRREVSAAVATMRERPEQWPLVPTVRESLGTRRVVVRGFPYAIVFMILEHEVAVIALAHGSRRPGYWRERSP